MSAGHYEKHHGHVKIAARLRPRLDGELDDDSVKIVHSSNNTGGSSSGSSFISVANPRDPSQIFKFPFTSCYDQDSKQEEIFNNDVEPLIDVVYSGVTVTIFAYGVTSSGKTHTMQGTRAEPGVIPRVVRLILFSKAMFEKKDGIYQYQTSLTVSYMEIYKDEVYDLLVTRENAPKLPVRENDSGMVFVANLTRTPISDIEDFDNIYNAATKHRSVGATNLNRASSRSHAVLTIEATMVDPVANTTLTGKINLVDLAGSENNKLTGNDPSRMAESSAINKSLSVLGQVVHALNQGASRIPYRNSKLTRILQDALGGSSVGLLICNLAPGIKFRQDTLNTLNFAVRTKNVENRPVVNERDNRPAPKPHFAAVALQPPPAKPAPAILQAISTTAAAAAGTTGSMGRARGRSSMVPVSRTRKSSIGGASGFQPFGLPNVGTSRRNMLMNEKIEEEYENDRSGSLGFGMTEKEIDERISKAVEAAVEAEVTRRLAERERQRAEEEERAREAARREEGHVARPRSRSPTKENALPSGVLTPLLKRHKDLDDELKGRLQELERKYERGTKETALADVLSPVSKKKTGRAYVALARAHSEKGDLHVALDLYRKAETYVPDNVKLKERIIEIEWAVKNDTEFVPSPKPARKRKAKQRSKSTLRHETVFGEDAAASAVDGAASPGKIRRQLYETEFGTEVTNTESPNASSKRPFRDAVEELDSMSARTPVKRQKRPGPSTPSAGMMVDREAESQDDGVDVVAAAATMRRKVKLLSNTPSPLDDIADVVIIGVVSAKARQLLIPLQPSELTVRTHAICCTVGFLILLPIGVLVARYTRTLPYKWFWAHWIIQLVISFPVIVYGWVQGHKATTFYQTGHFTDPHEKMGLVLLILYLTQLVVGAATHFFKLPGVFRGRRAPHAYFHAILGLVIFACAQWQVHYGLFTEWPSKTGGLHQVPEKAKHAWLALTILFWVLYGLGLALIPRQFRQEKETRDARGEKTAASSDSA
ncbi:hypothetical protein D9619_008254 [Psilocybe cf. subviscida]|uniref:Kinesin-like protein n=1 Tax=Psilocybe cf. subviscida TaxID=2480587 RepID=A0A8H5AU72_9AGAR|nr:hypothetical protein D9619_008254 [Psilocybe cf. subviscida]